MLRAVIFDLDGVIVDSHSAHTQAWRTFFRSRGKEISDHDLAFVLEGHKREHILRHFLGELTEDQIRDYGAQKDALFRDSGAELRTIQGVPEFLNQLEAAALPVALGSSASRHRVTHVLEQLDLTRHFHAIVTGDDVREGKPDPTIFRLAAKGLRVDPGDILVCEDAVAGVEAARRAGMRCLAIAANGRGPLLKDAGADCVLPDFTGARLDELRALFGAAKQLTRL